MCRFGSDVGFNIRVQPGEVLVVEFVPDHRPRNLSLCAANTDPMDPEDSTPGSGRPLPAPPGSSQLLPRVVQLQGSQSCHSIEKTLLLHEALHRMILLGFPLKEGSGGEVQPECGSVACSALEALLGFTEGPDFIRHVLRSVCIWAGQIQHPEWYERDPQGPDSADPDELPSQAAERSRSNGGGGVGPPEWPF